MVNFGYWVFGRDMLNVNLTTLKNNGVTDIFLNYYAFETHGESKVLSWIQEAKKNNIGVHIWMQCFYGGSWINPKTADNSSKLKEAKKYADMKDVKGVHLDYLRYPGNAYKTEGGADAITNFVKQVRTQNPNTFLSCAVMPESDDKYYYGQDIDALGKIVDAILPMQYKGNYSAGTSWLASTSKTFSSKATLWSGLQSYKSDDDTSLLSASELINDTKTCIDNGAKGVVMFRYGLCPNINFNSLSPSTTTTTTTTSDKMISTTNIKEMATAVKTYIEKNKNIPTTITVSGTKYTYGQIAYILSYAIVNPNKDADVFAVSDAINTSTDSISEDIQKNDYQDIAKRVMSFIKQKKQCPAYATTKKSQKKMSPKVFIYMLTRIVAWYYNNNKTLPNYATVNSAYFTTTTTATSTPKSTKSKILNKDVYTLAKTVKASVEKNKKLESNFKVSDITYTNAEVAYIFAFAINNLKSDVSIPGIKAPSAFNSGQTINEDIYTSDYQDQAKRIVQYVKQNGQLPLYVTSVKSQKQISVQMFTYAFAKTLVWYTNNKNTLPNYCNYNTSAFGVSASTSTSTSSSTSTSTSTNTSTSKKKYGHSKVHCCNDMGQNNGYYCGPHSLQECFRNLTNKVPSQATIASWAGTTSSGTDHDGLNTAVKKFNSNYGFNLSVEWKSFSDVGWSGIKKIISSDNQDCVIHNLYRNKYGHYEVINKDYSNYCDVQNSLGDKCSSGCYYGYVEERSHSTYQSYINGISQKSIMIITRK
ncbi:MAG: hypothetical protein IKF82_00080 [Bacilli bacterium]|nr:hypothetical protein [Bacilli bacterium]